MTIKNSSWCNFYNLSQIDKQGNGFSPFPLPITSVPRPPRKITIITKLMDWVSASAGRKINRYKRASFIFPTLWKEKGNLSTVDLTLPLSSSLSHSSRLPFKIFFSLLFFKNHETFNFHVIRLPIIEFSNRVTTFLFLWLLFLRYFKWQCCHENRMHWGDQLPGSVAKKTACIEETKLPGIMLPWTYTGIEGTKYLDGSVAIINITCIEIEENWTDDTLNR